MLTTRLVPILNSLTEEFKFLSNFKAMFVDFQLKDKDHIMTLNWIACQVIKLLNKSMSTLSNRSTLLGQQVCQEGLRGLLGLGSQRFRRLLACARSGAPAPLDGRSMPKQGRHVDPAKRQNRILVVEFLRELYESLSEPLPETKGEVTGPKVMGFRRAKGKRPKKLRGHHQATSATSSEMRLLPPGSYTDYLQMLRVRHPEKKISLKLFTRVPRFPI